MIGSPLEEYGSNPTISYSQRLRRFWMSFWPIALSGSAGPASYILGRGSIQVASDKVTKPDLWPAVVFAPCKYSFSATARPALYPNNGASNLQYCRTQTINGCAGSNSTIGVRLAGHMGCLIIPF